MDEPKALPRMWTDEDLHAAFTAGIDHAMWAEGYAGPPEPEFDEWLIAHRDAASSTATS